MSNAENSSLKSVGWDQEEGLSLKLIHLGLRGMLGRCLELTLLSKKNSGINPRQGN